MKTIDVDVYRAALVFYATGKHLRGFEDWENVDGVTPNWLSSPDDEPMMVEDGGVARAVLAGHLST